MMAAERNCENKSAKKVFINNKFLANCGLKEGDIFYQKDNYILSSYAKDYFIMNNIKVVRCGDKEMMSSASEENITKRILCLLESDYKITGEAALIIANKVKDAIN